MPAEDTEKKGSETVADPKAEEKKGPSPLVKKLILFGIIIAVLAIETFVAIYLIKATRQEDPRVLAERESKEQEAVAKLKETTIGMTTEPIIVTVNISGEGEEERYAKVGIQLEFDDLKYPGLLQEIEKRNAKIKNILIMDLTSMKIDEIVSPAGKMKLRQSLRRNINNSLPKEVGTIREVFLSEFIIQ
jgi:flagellar basal body-associated protein FliL